MDEKSPELRRIGPYRLETCLGVGGMGEVYRAWDERLQRRVAIKRIRHDLETTSERRRRFRREARAAAGLSHPAIVQIHDILEDESGDAIVMEYVEGRPLGELIAAGELDGPFAAGLARQVAEGLARAHERGVVHRDLKAENVMVTPEDEAKILDFGLARPLVPGDGEASLTRDGAVLGTVRAMSPEQAAGEEVDARSDLFSLGVLLYEMFTGRSPFRGDNTLRILNQVLNHSPPPPRALRPELPPALSSLVEALLEKDPGRRPQSARQVADALAELAASPDLEGLPAAPPAAASPAGTGAAVVETPSDAPTVTPESPPRQAFSRGNRRAVKPRRVGRWLAVILAGVAVVATLLLYLQTFGGKPLSVLVLRPEVVGECRADAAALASGVQQAALATLFALEGLVPLDPGAGGPAPGSLPEAARAAAADEVLTASLEARDGACRISLRRVAGKDGRILWISEPFEPPLGPEYYLQLAKAVESRLRRTYPGHRPRSTTPLLEASDRDYAAFLELQRRVRSGMALGEPDLETLEELTVSSPRFLEAYILAAGQARRLELIERARGLIVRARELAPNDPRILDMRFRVELDGGRLDEAESALAELESHVPGDLRVLIGRARLAEDRGELEEAVRLWRRVVDTRPSWRHLFNLAGVELKHGEIDAARGNLERLLEISPENSLGRTRLGRLELLSGDLAKAETIYRTLTRTDPREPANFANLGTILYVRRDYEAAAESFDRALDLEPKNRLYRLNRADVELRTGRHEEARASYRELLAEIDELEPGELDAQTSLIQAQCLARLGDPVRAVEVTQRILRRHPENADVAFLAALVYALTGDLNPAQASALEAWRLGYQPVLFQLPEFDVLHAETEFRQRVLSEATDVDR